MNFNVKDVEFDFDDDYANGFKLTFDERYEFVKLYDILRDMDFELTPLQESLFEKIEMGVDKIEI